MTRKAIIEKTIIIINQLPEDKLTDISDFLDLVFMKHKENIPS